MSSVRIYLRNHEAAGQAGLDLFRRAVKNQRSRSWGEELPDLARAVEEDLRSLRQLMRAMSVPPDHVLALGLRLGERVGRLKPNGHLVSRSPLSDLIEVEGLLDAVRAKQAGWHALHAAHAVPVTLEPLLDDLLRRADTQVERLLTVHQQAAAAVLVP